MLDELKGSSLNANVALTTVDNSIHDEVMT